MNRKGATTVMKSRDEYNNDLANVNARAGGLLPKLNVIRYTPSEESSDKKDGASPAILGRKTMQVIRDREIASREVVDNYTSMLADAQKRNLL